MKILLSILLSTCFTSLVLSAPGTSYRRVESYSIGPSEVDSTLDTNHAIFVLDFHESFRHAAYNPQIDYLEISCNGVIRIVQLDSNGHFPVLVSPGNYKFQFYRRGEFDEIITDSISIAGRHRTEIFIDFTQSMQNVIYYKPVIYLYPPADTEVSVQIRPRGGFTFTYPEHGEKGWTGTAHPDGSTTIGNKTYPYLFWEGEGSGVEKLQTYSDGFVVKQEEVTTFLEDKLTEMGFNDKEKADFITFWGPRMAASEQGFAHFVFNSEYDAVAAISLKPAPQHLFRVYLLWTPLNPSVEITPKPQHIEIVQREQFYVIEWGGSELSPAHFHVINQ